MVRLHHRYVVVEINFDPEFQKLRKEQGQGHVPSSLVKAITGSIRTLHGVAGVAMAKAGLTALYCNQDKDVAVVRMRRSAHKIVTSAIPLVKNIDGVPAALRTLHTGATTKHTNLFLRKLERRQLELEYGKLKTDVQREQFRIDLEAQGSSGGGKMIEIKFH